MGNSEKLFTAVKSNNHKLIRLLATRSQYVAINAKNTNQATILHIAAWKGYLESVKVILACKGDPNIVGAGGSTPLHYAAKFGHVEIVKELLAHGAIYDMKTEKGKTPLELCNDPAIKRLLKTIDILFESVKMKRTQLIDDLNKIKDMSIAKAVVNARNVKKLTLIEAALISGCMLLRDTWDLIVDIDFNRMRDELTLQSYMVDYEQFIQAAQKCLINRMKIFGPESPVSLFFEKAIYSATSQLGKDHKALESCGRIYEIFKRTLGENCHVTLQINAHRGQYLLKMERYQEALSILEVVCEKLSQIEVKDYNEFRVAQNNLGVAYDKLGYVDKAIETFQREIKLGEIIGEGFGKWAMIENLAECLSKKV